MVFTEKEIEQMKKNMLKKREKTPNLFTKIYKEIFKGRILYWQFKTGERKIKEYMDSKKGSYRILYTGIKFRYAFSPVISWNEVKPLHVFFVRYYFLTGRIKEKPVVLYELVEKAAKELRDGFYGKRDRADGTANA